MWYNWGRGHLVQRVGEPNPYAYNFACSPSNFHASRIPVYMSPLWGFGYLVYAVFYKHAAPLGLNALLSPSPFLLFLPLPPPRPLRLCVESYHVSRFISLETAAFASP